MLIVFTDCQFVTEIGIKELGNLPKLEDLNILGMSQITGKSFKFFNNLKRVDISNCTGMRKEGLCCLINQCEKLKKLKLVNCSRKVIIAFLKSIDGLLRVRENNIDLLMTLSDEVRIRLTTITSNTFENKKAKIWYEVYRNDLATDKLMRFCYADENFTASVDSLMKGYLL